MIGKQAVQLAGWLLAWLVADLVGRYWVEVYCLFRSEGRTLWYLTSSDLPWWPALLLILPPLVVIMLALPLICCGR